MGSEERESVILDALEHSGFCSLKELLAKLPVSSTTLRRDLVRLKLAGKLSRVYGGAKLSAPPCNSSANLLGLPFHTNFNRISDETAAIGRAAAALCQSGDTIAIGGGSTTAEICWNLKNLDVRVLTNSLPIASVLLQQSDVGVAISAGAIFREQNIVLNPTQDFAPQNFHASRMFMSCAAIGRLGLMQSDIILAQAERQLLAMADELVVLAESDKFTDAGGYAICELSRVTTVITDIGITPASEEMIRKAGIRLIKV